MNKYRKTLLSSVAAIAISSSLLSAGYLPLTSVAKDDTWILFGVNGLAGTADQASDEGSFSITDSTTNTWTDSAADEVPATNTSNMATLDAVDSAKAPVEVRVNVSGFTYSQTEPVRTMYVTGATGESVIFSFTYKASLEGEKLEYKASDSDSVFFVTLDSSKTYSTPAPGVITPATTGGGGGVTLNSLVGTTANVVDYNLANNPPQVAEYDVAAYYDAEDANDSVRMYGYDAGSGTWELFDSRNSDAANDFLTIQKGKGYWAKIDTNDDNTTTGSGQLAGMVLGSSTISTADYDALNLANGWNLISFDNTDTEIRRATTGMLVAITTAAQTIKLYDSSLNNSVDVTFAVGDSDVELARKINYAISKAKVLGTLPKVFNLKAFPTNTANTLALISDKKFGIEDAAADTITGIQTINGAKVWDSTNSAIAATAPIDPVNGTIYESRYGEYFLMVEPLVGAGTAAGISVAGATVLNVTTTDGTTILTELVDINTSMVASTASLDALANIKAISVDVDQNTTDDYVLMSSAYPFDVRDFTVSRVFKYIADANGTVDVKNIGVVGNDIDALAINGEANASVVAEDINATALLSDDDGNGNIVIVSTLGGVNAGNTDISSSSVKFSVLHASGGDNLQAWDGTQLVTTTSDLAKGSVKAVYAPNAFVQQEITNKTTLDVTSLIGVTDSNVSIVYTTMYDTNVTGVEISDIEITTAAAFKTALESQLTDLNLTSTVDISGNVLTISGYDIINIYTDENTTGSYEVNGTSTLGYVASADATPLTDDLKYNSVYSPNYVLAGPLYTMRDTGFSLQALVTGATDISDGSVTWESIDLTRPTSEWLLSQDYNLFSTDPDAAYWAYLGTPATNSMSLTGDVDGVSYTTYFDGTTATNFFSGNIKVDLADVNQAALDDDSVRVVAIVSGKEIELKKDTTGTYTGAVNLYELKTSPISGTSTPVYIKVADGIGNKIEPQIIYTIDNTKPAAPVIEAVENGISVTPVADATGYYVFSGLVPESYTDGDEIAQFSAGGSVSGICAQATQASISDSAGSIQVVAVDGNGTITQGNISDIATSTFMAIAKSRMVLSDFQDVTGATSSSTGGTDYNSSCEAAATYTTNEYGISMTSETSNTTVKIAYTPLTLADGLGAGISVFVGDGTTVAKIDYADAYVGDEVFILLGTKTYGYTLPTRIIGEATTDTSYADLTADLKTGVTF